MEFSFTNCKTAYLPLFRYCVDFQVSWLKIWLNVFKLLLFYFLHEEVFEGLGGDLEERYLVVMCTLLGLWFFGRLLKSVLLFGFILLLI